MLRVGFDDNLNDLELFNACDVKIAVANAVEKLKEHADTIIGSNDQDSVAVFIDDHENDATLRNA